MATSCTPYTSRQAEHTVVADRSHLGVVLVVEQPTPTMEESLSELCGQLRSDITPPDGGGRCRVGMAQMHVAGRPTRAKLRPLSAPLRIECERQVQALLKEGLIVPSKSPWASAPVGCRSACFDGGK
eukprot:GHVS01077403.1.p1 GENE.GHVS01077403.1~~GHVS01077403.1.p1  ORF type:complete len:127 (+),score=14.44 GHVS01077403.1:437-817(+)